jgi:cation diffusion facilitator family transporter
VAALLTFFAVRLAGQPPDREHRYGHGKAENLSAFIEALLLVLTAGWVIYEAVRRLFFAQVHVEANVWAFLVMAGSIVVDVTRSRALHAAAVRHGSQALEADALHFSSDMWSSFAVLVGLCAVAFGYPQADAIAAIVVAVFVCLAGWRLGKRTIDTLTDTAPRGVTERIARIARKIPGIVAVEQVRTRPAGATLFVEIALAVSRTLPLGRVAALKDQVTRAIQNELPRAELTVTTHPRALDDETVLDRVMVIARNRGLAIHHVMIHEIAGKLLLSLDLEVDGRLSLRAAHEIATGLENAVAEELGTEVEVETHIEPLQIEGDEGRDASGERVAAVSEALSDVARSLGPIEGVHDVRVRETPAGEIVNFHCLVDPALPVAEVHEKVDEVERGLKARFPSVQRVVGHAEPRR